MEATAYESKSRKTLLILGGSRYVIPVIEAAHELGCHVVTCDYLPDNTAHRYSDEYRNVSIVDKDAVLRVAREVGADGITSFGTDPGVVSAAYVAEQLGLPFQADYETTLVLQNKELFRSFLLENGFACPKFVRVPSKEDASEVAGELSFPVIVKPTDAAGSKGVRRVDGPEGIAEAVEYALRFSLSGACIIEEFLESAGATSDADSFTVDGKFLCVSFTGQMFDADSTSPFVPASYTLPSKLSHESQLVLISELQRLSNLMELRDGPYNIETRVTTAGKPYIMEVSPRGGGNRLSEFLAFASGVDLVAATVRAALGLPVQDLRMPDYDGVWYQQVLHSEVSGVFEGLWFDPEFKRSHVRNEQIWVEPGEQVESFTAANFAFGSVFMRFEDRAQLDEYLADPAASMKILVSPSLSAAEPS